MMGDAAARRRVLVAGLDGATFDLIRPWAGRGTLPTLDRLMREGAWAPLRSTVPPVTPLAWSSFVTGTNPGQHGIFGFAARAPDTYDWYATSAATRQGITLWDWASCYHRQVGVVNMPMTYPPEPIPGGYMVSGLGVPDVDVRFALPDELQRDLLRRFDPEQLVEQPVSLYDPDSFVDYLLRTVDDNLAITNVLLDRFPDTDLLCTVFTATDRVQHFYWRQMAEGMGSERQRTAIERVYRRVDGALGQLIDALPGWDVLVMSDHGAGPYRHLVGMNQWLASQGWLRWQAGSGKGEGSALGGWRRAYRRVGHALPGGIRRRLKALTPASWMAKARREMTHWSLPVVWEDTRAYSAGFGGNIYLNLRGREPLGQVGRGSEANRLLDEIEAALRGMRDPDTGSPVVEQVHRGQELYRGARVDEAPDLVVSWHDGYYSMAGMSGPGAPIFQGNLTWPHSRAVHSAEHRQHGILVAHGPQVRPGVQADEADILDLAPSILHLMGLPIPSSMEGRVLAEWLTTGRTPTVEPAGAGKAPGPQPAYSDEEEQLVRDRLRDLGYLD
jgi:predicted AlkP superfamily phosphohydrolase/phosphomutase